MTSYPAMPDPRLPGSQGLAPGGTLHPRGAEIQPAPSQILQQLMHHRGVLGGSFAQSQDRLFAVISYANRGHHLAALKRSPIDDDGTQLQQERHSPVMHLLVEVPPPSRRGLKRDLA